MERDELPLKLGPGFAPAVSEDLLTGAQLLRRAFLETPALSANRDAVVIPAGASTPPAMLIHRGVAYQSTPLPDGRRSIADILLPGDIVGAGNAVLGRCDHEIVAASTLGYRLLKAEKMRELSRDPRICLRILALAAEERWRIDRHLTVITRFDARGRIASMILGVYERLRRNQLIARPTFNLPLTQEQVADHLGITMVHVSRTLRRMREERLVLVDRQVVIIIDIDELRRAASGLPALDLVDPAKIGQDTKSLRSADNAPIR